MKTKEQVINKLEEEVQSLKAEISSLKRLVAEAGSGKISRTGEEEKYRELFENAPMPYQSLNINGEIITVNKAWLDMLGYTKKAVTGTYIGNYLTEESVKKLQERFPLFLKRGLLEDADFEMITSTGKIVFVTVNGRIQPDSQGEFKATHCLLINVTEKRITQEELTASELRFRQIIQSSPMGMHLYHLQEDNRLVFTAANPAADKILGVDHRQFVGKSIEEAFPGLINTEVPEKYRDIARKGISWHTEQIEYHDGAIQGAYEVVAFQTEPGKMATVFSDITGRKRTEEALRLSEERLSFALSATNDGIWDYKPLENELFWSDRFYIMLGYNPGDFSPSYEKWSSLVHPDDREIIEEALNNCLLRGKDYYSEECRLRNKKGEYQWFLLRGKVIERDVSGTVLRMSGTHVDITERKQFYHELLKEKERAEESDRLKSAFLANLSHEIRTPMNAMLGFADLLSVQGTSTEERSTYIDIIQKSGKQLLSIINDIIEISQIETGQITLHLTPVDLVNLMQNLYQQLRVTIPASKTVELKFIAPPIKDESRIITDEVKLQQILNNLISNAIKYTERGSITVAYEFKDDREIRFMVQDTGIGIDRKYHQLIFERFRQVEGDTAIKYGGSGLGLAISKAYVTMLGGEISVCSLLGKGSTFTFTIPHQQYVQPDTGIARVTEKLRKRLSKCGPILIAEDDENSYQLLSRFFSGTCIQLLRAKNGKEAVTICRKNLEIALVLMDIKMPVMNGLDAARLIKKTNPSLPLLAQTAYALEEDKTQIAEAGFSGYLTKPIEKEKLLDLIESLL
jgi:PAS domain S-box-containing protein